MLVRVVAMVMIWSASAALAQMGLSFDGIAIDGAQPVEINADQVQVDQDSGRVVFSGHVVVAQGQMRLSAARVAVTYGAEDRVVLRLEAQGNVLFATRADQAEAQKASYDLRSKRLTLSGDVLVTQGAATLASERLELDLATGRATLTGRVHSRFGGG